MNDHKRTLLTVLIALVVFGCSAFFAAAYDPNIDSGVGVLRTKLAGHYDALLKHAGTPAADWRHSTGFYDSVRADVDALRFQAALQRGNEPTLHALDLLRQNVNDAEGLHRDGLSPGEIPIVRALLDTQLRLLLKLEQAKRGKEGS